MKKTVIALVLAVLLRVPAVMALGTTTMDILKVPSGIKAQGMGGAYTALADGPEAFDINPAGLALTQNMDIMLVHNIYLQDVFFDSVYYSFALEGAGVLSIGGKFLSAGTVAETGENPDGTYSGETGQETYGMCYLGGLAYSINLGKLAYNDFTKNVNAGIAVKFSGESIGPDYAEMGVSTDIGFIYTAVLEEEDFLSNRGQMLWNRAGFGIAFKNVGTSFGSGMTPLAFALGVYTQFINVGTSGNRVRVALDAEYNMENGINAKAGIEYGHNIGDYNFSIRTGGNFNPEERLSSGFAAGAGFGMKLGDVRYSVDYVFLPYTELGSSHKVGLYIKL